MINLYLSVAVVFFIISMTSLLDSVRSLKTTRSRETKVWNRGQIKRDKMMIMLSPVWPAAVVIMIKELVDSRELIFVRKDEQKKRS